MLATIKNIIAFPITFWIRVRSIYQISNTSHKRIFVFDIDNTIADTVPSMLSNIKWKNEAERISTLAVFIKMYKLIRILNISPNNQILFMTARNYLSQKATEKWLIETGLMESGKPTSLIITRTAEEKYNILKNIKLNNKRLYYIDDLSYINKDGTLLSIEHVYKKWLALSTKNKKINFYSLTEINSFLS